MVATGIELVSHEVFECPGCGRFVEPGEDYVTAQEYDVEPGFGLHQVSRAAPDTAERRFHVQHFRGLLGNRFYVLITESSSSL